MKKWQDFHAVRRLTEAGLPVEDMILSGYHAMSDADKQKVQQVLASGTWADSWTKSVQAALAKLGSNANPQQIAAVMLDGIDAYLGSSVSTSSNNSARFSRAMTQRQPAAATPERADYQGNFGRQQTLWNAPGAQHGEVPQAEIQAKGLNPHHHDVWNGSMADAPPVYRYIWLRGRNKLVYNPSYRG